MGDSRCYHEMRWNLDNSEAQRSLLHMRRCHHGVRPVRVTYVPERSKAIGGITRCPTAVECFLVSLHGPPSPARAGLCHGTVGRHKQSSDSSRSVGKDMTPT